MNVEVNKEILISKVFLKTLIWDKRIKDHSNRNAVDKAWQEIGREMDTQEDVLRKKWKYLRDQFAHELGKTQPARSGDPAGKVIESKWPYFKSLMFLKGIIKPRTSTGNLALKKNVEAIDNRAMSIEESNNTLDEIEDDEASAFNTNDGNQGTFNNAAIVSENSQRKRKRSDDNANYNQTIISIEDKKTKLLGRVLNGQSLKDNDDFLFFRSLLPHVDKIPQDMKLRFRNRVQELVEEFAYPHIYNQACSPVSIQTYNPVSYSNTTSCSTDPLYVSPSSETILEDLKTVVKLTSD